MDEKGASGAPAAFPDNWREIVSTGADGKIDQKKLDQVKRFASPSAMADSLWAAQQRVRSGEYKRNVPPPDAADAEGLKAWRADNGIPEAPEGYEILPQGSDLAKMTPVEQENVKFIQAQLLEKNVPVPQAKAMAAILQQLGTQQAEKRTMADAQLQDATEDALRAEWGNDFRGNLSMNWNLLNKHFGPETAEALRHTRLADGRLLLDIPAFSKGLNQLARTVGGDVMLDGDIGGAGGSSLEARKAEIEKVMSTDMRKYQADPAMAKEYNGILEKLERAGKLNSDGTVKK